MPPFGMVNQSYPANSLLADAERTVNWFPELVDSQLGKNTYYLLNTPGLKLFANTVSLGVGRGILAMNNGRILCVIGQTLYELGSAGTLTSRGTLTYTTGIVTMDSNGSQVFIVEKGVGAGAGVAWIFTLGTNILTNVTSSLVDGAGSNPLVGAFCDGYFLVLFKGTSKFQISALFDGTTWNALNTQAISTFPDQILNMKVIRREVVFMGTFNSCVWYNAGGADFPFALVPSAAIEHGTCSSASVQKLNDSLFFLGINQQGRGVVRRLNGYVTQRVSTHAVENALEQYLKSHPVGGAAETLATADAYTYEEGGHAFYVMTIPGMETSWAYDVTTNMWHERASYTGSAYTVHPAVCCAIGFDRNFVLDRNGTGNVYEMGTYVPADTGATYTDVRRMRIAPHLSAENQWQRHAALEFAIDADSGRNVSLSWSDDGGVTYSTPVTLATGSPNDTWIERLVFRRLGRTRDRLYKLEVTDPAAATNPTRVIDAYLRPAA